MSSTAPPRWDTAQMRTSHCDVASARLEGGGITLAFGRQGHRADAPQVEETQLLGRFSLDADAARGLARLLNTLLADHEMRGDGGGHG
jgi:hypothetical protein